MSNPHPSSDCNPDPAWGDRSRSEQELHLLYQITQAIAEVENFDAALEATLRHVCNFTHWAFGEVWIPAPDNTHLYLSNACHCCDRALHPFREASRAIAFAPNQGLPGRVWMSQQPEWIGDVSQQKVEHFLRVDAARRVGLKAAFGVPVLSGTEVVAVLVFFAWEVRQQDTTLLQLVTSVALQLGQILKRKQVEAALRESEATNRAIVRAIPDLLVRIDRTGKYTQLLSLGSVKAIPLPEQIPNPTVFDVLPEELATWKVESVRRALATGEMQIYEHEILIEGEWRWEEVRVTPMSDDEVLVMVRDITEQKQAETALQELNQELEARGQRRTAALQASEARYRALMENASDAILLADLEGNITEGNRKAEELLGYTQAELRRLHFTQIHPLGELPRTIASFADGISSGASQLLDGLMLRKDGTLVPVDITCSVVEVAGKRIVQGIFRDISDRKHMEAKLRKKSAHLLAAQRIANLGSWEFDLNTKEITWSLEVFRIFGRDPALGEPTFEELQTLLHPDDCDCHARLVQRTIATGEPYKIEYRFYHSDGSLRYALAQAEPVLNEVGTLVRLVGTVLDITDRKRTEARLIQINEDLMRATRLKDEFLATMSHELRTPLNAILGMAECLQEEIFGMLSDRQRHAVNTIQRSGKHLLDLINDILDLSKIESGKLELDISQVSATAIAKGSLTFVQPMARKKNILIGTRIPEDIGSLWGDNRRLCQVLINLLSNAVKFTSEGGSVTLEIGTTPPVPSPRETASAVQVLPPLSNPCLYFSVIDTGIGIAPENLGKLFQSFVQIDSSLNRQYAGTGLGLVLVRRVVELHRGTLWVESELHRGSCFTIGIPCNYAPKMPETPGSSASRGRSHSEGDRPSPHQPLAADVPAPRILLAEDNRANTDTISDYLTNKGYHLILAKNGEEAVRFAKSQSPNLILMDIQMPGMDGLEAMRRIRAEPALQSIPIIALTALALTGDREACLQAGADEYVAKPIQLNQLTTLIQTLMQKFLEKNNNGYQTIHPGH